VEDTFRWGLKPYNSPFCIRGAAMGCRGGGNGERCSLSYPPPPPPPPSPLQVSEIDVLLE